jgi:mRNA-degrading endonuclease toxin of MazEF toxin-antitoxin module
MQINQFEIWLADLKPRLGTEPGKTRPVLVIQTNLLNKVPHIHQQLFVRLLQIFLKIPKY